MRIVVNGWFLDQLATGSGQYLAALTAWLPHAGAAHDLILVIPRSSQPVNGKGHTASGSLQSSMVNRQTSIAPGWQTIEASTPFDAFHRHLAKLWFEQVAFPRACWRLRADVALAPYWGSPWWRPCLTVVTVHDLIPLLLPLYRGGPLQRAYTGLVARTARRAHAVLTDSEASRRDVIEHLRIPPDRVHAVHLAAGEPYRPVGDPAELARVRAKYRLPETPFLLYLGGFDARKNVVRMIEGYARMTMDHRRSTIGTDARAGMGDAEQPMVGLVIAGRLPGRDSAFAPDPRLVVEQLGLGDRVHFTGWVDEADKPVLYSLARGALYLSEYEGFGLPVLEAMACGCPLVAGGVRGGDGDQRG
jgi:glycosyltransferase involved in cell wall biosynthesis